MGAKIGEQYSDKGVKVIGIALNVTSRKLFFKKMKEHFDYDPKAGQQVIGVPDDTYGLEGSFNLRAGGFPAYYLVDIRDGWKIIHHETALNTGNTSGTCAVPAKKTDHSAYVNRMTRELSSIIDGALTDESTEETPEVTET